MGEVHSICTSVEIALPCLNRSEARCVRTKSDVRRVAGTARRAPAFGTEQIG